MPPVGFEPTTSAGERPQTYALDRTATGTGLVKVYQNEIGSAVRGRSVAERRANEKGTESALQLCFETDQKSDHDIFPFKIHIQISADRATNALLPLRFASWPPPEPRIVTACPLPSPSGFICSRFKMSAKTIVTSH